MKFWMAIPIGLTLMFANGRSASAQSVQEFSTACQQDIVKHCPQAAMAPTALQACLLAKKADLGDSCKKLVAGKK